MPHQEWQNGDGDNRQKGQRFSFQYLDRPMGLRDGPRLRRRVASLLGQIGTHDERKFSLANFVTGETGEQVPWLGTWGPNWDEFLTTCPLDTFLDCVTVVARYWATKLQATNTARWVAGCERIFREERAAYTVDKAGGVHPYVDPEFHLARLHAIAALQGERYVIAANSFGRAYEALQGSPAQPRDAIRLAFDAAEALFKMMTGKARLTAGDVKSALVPLIDRALRGTDPVAQRASHHMASSLADWVDAAHNYRHAPGEAEPPEPPEAVCHLLMTQAAGFVRWLAQLDHALQAAGQ